MIGGRLKLYRRISVVYLVVTVIIISIVFFISYVNENITSANHLIHLATTHSVPISLVLILISVGMGYFLATITFNELRKTKSDSKRLLELLFLFLGEEDQIIVDHLVNNKGKSTQSEISRLPSMNRVKAFRSIKRMEEKNLLSVESHGKIRNVSLKENVYELLLGVE